MVQDLFLTETAELADVVLPAAGWGEKTGCFTNVNRTVHLSEKAVEPPGEARSDLDIFLAYAEAMGFTDKDGYPLITWRTSEEAFDAWREATRGRPVDYTGLSYDKLRGPSGIPWPVNEEHPDGTDRLYADGVFPTDTDYCETYGHDLLTGGAVTETEHRAMNPAGRAFLKGADWTPAHEEPSRGLSAALHDRSHRLPVPHPHQDRSFPGAAPGRARCVGRALTGRRAAAGHQRGRLGPGRVTARRHRGPRPDRPGHGGRGLRALPLRPLGPRRPRARRRPPPGQRADHDRLGPGLQAALLQDRRLQGHQGPRRRRPSPAPTTTASAPALPAGTGEPAGARTPPPPPGPATTSHVLEQTPTYALDPTQRRS